jgi:hypothetical protein
MVQCRLNFLVACAGFFLSVAHAGDLPVNAKSEIDQLLNRLGQSGCQFNRNGTWYSASEAKDHLNKKLDYVMGKNLIRSAEQFIEVAASKSSLSGQNYQVKCAAQAPMASSVWLNTALNELRGQARKP